MTHETILPLHGIQYEEMLRQTLLEDLGRGGDLTTDALIPASTFARARIVARSSGRVAGVEVAARAFSLLDPQAQCEVETTDGCDVEPNQALLRVQGPARGLLSAERTALNFLGRLSGVATMTRAYVQAVSGTKARVCCTRKTTPGLRILEKYAVRCGGGFNHRFGLDDAVLIKDNHLLAVGGVAQAVARARATVGHTVLIEVEVETIDQLREALNAGVDAVLLDNMSPDRLRDAVGVVSGRVLTEASGGITLDTAAEIAATGVNLLSVGALTHSAPNLDLSMELDG